MLFSDIPHEDQLPLHIKRKMQERLRRIDPKPPPSKLVPQVHQCVSKCRSRKQDSEDSVKASTNVWQRKNFKRLYSSIKRLMLEAFEAASAAVHIERAYLLVAAIAFAI